MERGLKTFKQMLRVATNPAVREEIKLTEVAAYIANDAHAFANEVAVGIEENRVNREALEQIGKIVEERLKGG